MNFRKVRIIALIAAGSMALASAALAATTAVLVIDCGAACGGTVLQTASIQKAIDTAAPRGGTVSFKPGTYLTGALFLKSGVTLDIPDGVTITGSQDIKDFPELPTRIAGIEMTWPAALINVRDAHDVIITGKGTIDENARFDGRRTTIFGRFTRRRACAGPPITTPSG
jgi:polygalacturonase